MNGSVWMCGDHNVSVCDSVPFPHLRLVLQIFKKFKNAPQKKLWVGETHKTIGPKVGPSDELLQAKSYLDKTGAEAGDSSEKSKPPSKHNRLCYCWKQGRVGCFLILCGCFTSFIWGHFVQRHGGPSYPCPSTPVEQFTGTLTLKT